MSTNSETAGPSKGFHIALWVVQVLLALAFGMAGIMKATTPLAELAAKMPWVNTVPSSMVRFIGTSEFLGAVGLILPSVTRVKPNLTPIAGGGLVLVMILASVFHITRGEMGALPVNVVLGGLAAFVAWGRTKKAPIAPKG